MKIALNLIVVALIVVSLIGCAPQKVDVYRVYVGTATSPDGSKGIYRFDLDTKNGHATVPVLAASAVNPTFLVIHPDRKSLYATGAAGENAEGARAGSVTSYAIDAQTGDLKAINTQHSGGSGPCHVAVDAAGRTLLVANYGGGSLASLPILADRSLGEIAGFSQHAGGSGVNAARQKGPHAHWVGFSPDQRRVLSADLGQDRVAVYDYDAASRKLVPNEPATGHVPPGGGPRHFAFHPTESYAYTNNELTSTVTVFRVDPQSGKLDAVQTLSTLPPNADAIALKNSTAQILTHPNGRFLYVSNRGHDSIAIFVIDPVTGLLRVAEPSHTLTGGNIPRNFNISPDGRFLIVANQESNNLRVFAINPKTGALHPMAADINVPKPMCVQFMAIR